MKKLIAMLVFCLATLAVQAQEVVVSWCSNGMLMAEGLEPGSTGVVEAVSNLSDTFANVASFFDTEYVADSNGIIHVSIPMFFQVQGIPAPPVPEGMVEIPAGINNGTNPLGEGESYSVSYYPETYSLMNNSGFYMDQFEVTNDEIVRVMQWAYDNGKITVSVSTVLNAAGYPKELLDLDDADCCITWDGADFGLKALKATNYPCVEITWYGAAAYCNYRSEMDGKTPCYDLLDWSCDLDAGGYRLPTSDEWGYAARGGLSSQRFPWGDTITHSNANYYSSSSYSYDTSATRGDHPDYDEGGYPYTSPVGDFAANGYGLYDMTGNVWEWCSDWYPDYVGSYRVGRGGSWYLNAFNARCGIVFRFHPFESSFDVGFRSVLPAN